jgi:hypothetical protein
VIWEFKEGRKPYLELEEPVSRARVRLAVMHWMRVHRRAPSWEVREALKDSFPDDCVDGFDEGVRLGTCYER